MPLCRSVDVDTFCQVDSLLHLCANFCSLLGSDWVLVLQACKIYMGVSRLGRLTIARVQSELVHYVA